VTALNKLFRTTVFRLSLLYVAVFGLAVFVAAAYIYWQTQTSWTRQLDATVVAELRGLAEQYRTGGAQRLIDTIAERSATPGNDLYLVTDAAGHRLAGNLRVVTPELWNTVGPVIFTYRRPSAGGTENRLAFATVLRLEGDFRLVVGRDIEDRQQLQGQLQSAILVAIAVLTLAGLGGGLLLGSRLLARVDAITEASKSIMAGDLSQRLPIKGGGDELDRLSAGLNGMFARIEQLMRGLREVSDNIAHDLKTPLTRLRNRAEAALRSREGEASYRDALKDTIEEADTLIRTFDALLNIARMEAGARGAGAKDFDVSEVALGAVELYEPLAEEKGLSIVVDAGADVVMRGERQLIAQAIANLLDNAIKYSAANSGPAGNVGLQVRPNGTRIEIIVSDQGPGIASADRERALRRFVRLEASRTTPGSGLGLSLVAAVARLHGGNVRLEDNDPGLRAVMTLARGVDGAPETVSIAQK
jgi:signal transduction histidine kinase